MDGKIGWKKTRGLRRVVVYGLGWALTSYTSMLEIRLKDLGFLLLMLFFVMLWIGSSWIGLVRFVLFHFI